MTVGSADLDVASADQGSRVSLRSIRKAYGSVVAVDSLDLDVVPGEFITLLGPSGSGKTTVLGIIAGLVRPDAGRIRVDGADITDSPPHKRGFGMVFQSYALFPHMTVAGNVAFPLEVRRFPRPTTEQRVQAVLEMIGLPTEAGRLPSQLSGGQQQRVAVARAIVFDPKVVLMDEPLSALDRRLRESLQFELRDLQRRLGITVIFVTHDQTEAMALSDRVAVMNHGRMLQIGSPAEVYERPANAFVSSFVGDTNRMSAKVVGGEAAAAVVEVAGGHRFRATASHELAPEGAVEVHIRLERVRLQARRDHGIPASVESRSFLGDSLRYRLRIANGDLIEAKTPNVEGAYAPAAGDDVAVWWADADARILE